MGTIRRTRDHPRRQEGSAFRTRDRRVRPLQTKNQNVALHPISGVTHVYEIDSPSKRPAASVPLSIRAPPIPTLPPCLLTEVIPYEGGPWPTFRDLLVPLATRKAKSLEAEWPEGSPISWNTGFLQEAQLRIENKNSCLNRPAPANSKFEIRNSKSSERYSKSRWHALKEAPTQGARRPVARRIRMTRASTVMVPVPRFELVEPSHAA